MMDLDSFRSIGTVARFQKNEIVFSENETGENMYVVLEGLFGVYINSFTSFPVRVAGIERGSFFGEMSVIDGWPRSATVISEDDGTVIVIEKDKFGSLLEKRPDIATNIRNNLRERVESAVEMVHKAGKKPHLMPMLLGKTQPEGVKDSLAIMTILAQQIRLMNNLISASADYADTSEPLDVAPQPLGTVKLLPEGHPSFDSEDHNDNTRRLIARKVTCPYCTVELEAYVPLFSELTQKEVMPDGRVIFNDFNILLYTNIVCPNCNYTDAYQEFYGRGPVQKQPKYSGNQFRTMERFEGFTNPYKHTIDETVLSYYLNIECLSRTSKDPLRFARAWVRLYWLYRDHSNETFARRAAEKARYYFANALDKNSGAMHDNEKMQVKIILGELSIFLGDFDRVRVYLVKSLVELSEKNQVIVDSINYANKIQKNILPKDSVFINAFSDYSIIWDPRDMVGGDIYWIKNFDKGTVLCVCDCTGHGIPGAFLTMLVASVFEDMVNEKNCDDTAGIIWILEQKLTHVFNVKADADMNGTEENIKTGCDLAVLFIAQDGSVTISSGNTHVFICDGKEVTRIRGQKIYVGEGKLKSKEDVKSVEIPANPNHKFYIASDGLYDQVGGAEAIPFGYNTFKRIILENHNESQSEISDKIWKAFESYRGGQPRRDDFELITFKPRMRITRDEKLAMNESDREAETT